MSELLDHDATDQLVALAAGEISARELLQATVGRADATARALNAVVARDLGRAFADADGCDAQRAEGRPMGRLAGLPMTIKDMLHVEGLPASGGLPGPIEGDTREAVVVARARREGAIIWGKTNAPARGSDCQTYNARYGTTNNPWNPARTPGGSSGGSAVAVATGAAALEIGSDIGGSLRVPASFCGVFAHKPTFDLVPQTGHWPADLGLEFDMAVIGPVARSARDLTLLLPIIADAPSPPEPPPSSPRGLRLGLWLDEPAFALDGEVKAVLEAFAAKLAHAGAHVEPIASPVDGERLLFAYTWLLFPLITAGDPPALRAAYEILRWPAKLARAFGDPPLSLAQAILACGARHGEWLNADIDRGRMRREAALIFKGFDALIAPCAPVTAFPHDHRPMPLRRLKLSDGRGVAYTQTLGWNGLASVLGFPAAAIPAGRAADGLPVGAQLIGPPGADMPLLAIAETIEREIGGFVPPPPLRQARFAALPEPTPSAAITVGGHA